MLLSWRSSHAPKGTLVNSSSDLSGAARRLADSIDFPYSCDDTTGRLLAALVAATRPDARVIELGTGAGVGTAWLALGLHGRPDITVVTVESDSELAEKVAELPWPKQVEVRHGRAEAALTELGEFDLIFADAEGGKWSDLSLTIAALRLGGILVVDDMDPDGYATAEHRAAIATVRETLLGHPELLTVDLPVASGLMLATRVRRHEGEGR